jgi:NAD(P)-dependent dehydrogenase (short-subunit alcohol dehydrogenase family)
VKRKALVIGGTSGLGLELASLLKASHREVFITGRRRPVDLRKTSFRPLDLSKGDYIGLINNLFMRLGAVDTVVFAAGFGQFGKLEDLARPNIENMIQVGLSAPAMVLRTVLQFQKTLPEFIAITSTSQWTPRADEPVYCAAKAGLAMLVE